MADSGVVDIISKPIQDATKKTGEFLPLTAGQTVCLVKNEKGENCWGHMKQWYTAPKELLAKAAAGNTLHRCQRCGTIYEGPPQEYLHPKIKK
jgi:hypothetical protein